ncbi:Mariner Mos1 transposase [Eumeta japonica]|uniref:Protein YIF1 n=1 Tax=Eumeta variegata TaxID=151549 RepID=A0A4C1WFF6_EUMVA|nr:Mariner Mos1 transposase [Eumeta japonica]
MMATFGQNPMVSPAQLTNLIQQPVMQDMALQYGGQLARAGGEAVRRELHRVMPFSRLRYYFAVDTRYVVHKLMLLLFPFAHKKSVAEAHRMLSNTYGEAAISERTYRERFQRFKSGDFDVENQHGGGRKKVFEDADLEALLDQD